MHVFYASTPGLGIINAYTESVGAAPQ